MEKRMCFLSNNNEILDRISWFPVHIIHQILDCLPVEDAVRTSVLSKTWKGFCSSYPIVPNLRFDHNKFALKFLLAAGETGQEPDIDEIRERFINFVECQLSNMKQRKLSVRKVSMNVAVNDPNFFPRVDHLMELVRELSEVQELCFFVQTNDSKWVDEIDRLDVCYSFPWSVLASKGLCSLNARGCKFFDLVNNTAVPFSSLQQLSLSRAELDMDALINLARCCPGIESLKFKVCTFMIDNLNLSEFPRLKKASVLTAFGWLESIEFQGTSLEYFKCDDADPDAVRQLECVFTPAACGSIRVLTLMGCAVNPPSLFVDLTNTFPLLEEAHLSIHPCAQRLRAANHYLRRLSFYEPPFVTGYIKEIRIDCPNLEWFKFFGRGPKEVYINCPNLNQFCYTVNSKLSQPKPVLPLFTPSACMKDIYVQFAPILNLDDSWFIKLRRLMEHLGEVGPAGCVIHLHLGCILQMVEFSPKEFGTIQEASQVNNVVHLEISLSGGSGMNLPALVDGLIWSTRPTTLIVHSYCYSFLKDVSEKLAKKSRGENCEEFCNKCWWHHVQGFDVESKSKNIGHGDGRSVTSFFKFNWSSNLTLPPTRQPEFFEYLCSYIPVEKTPEVFRYHQWDGARWT